MEEIKTWLSHLPKELKRNKKCQQHYHDGIPLIQKHGKNFILVRTLTTRSFSVLNHTLLMKELCKIAGVDKKALRKLRSKEQATEQGEGNKEQGADTGNQEPDENPEDLENGEQELEPRPDGEASTEEQDDKKLKEPRNPREEFTKIKWDDSDNPDVVIAHSLYSMRVNSYHNRYAIHEKLKNVTSKEEAEALSREVILLDRQNRACHKELSVYNETGTYPEKHPIFEQRKKIAAWEAIKHDPVELNSIRERAIKEKRRTEIAIEKGDKPHLDEKRNAKIEDFEFTITEISKIIGKKKQ